MSKIFYDHLIVLEEVEVELKNIASSNEEKEELWKLVDELVHKKVFGLILDKLPKDNHTEFLKMFEKAPYDEGILEYLKGKIGQNIEELIKQEIGSLAFDLLSEIKNTPNR